MADVCVLVLNWNVEAVLAGCIDGLLRQEYGGTVRVVVVDNASTDGSLDVLAGYGDRIEVLRLAENVGFAKGNNEGFRQRVGTPLVVLVNPDTEFLGTDALSELLTPLSDPRVGLVGPRVLNADRTTQRSCAALPSISSLLLLVSGLHLLLPDSARRRVAPVVWSHDRSSDTGWIGGACLAMRSADFQMVGGFSEATFMYGEDLDLNWRIKRPGKRVRFQRSAEMVHCQDVWSSQRWTPEELAPRKWFTVISCSFGRAIRRQSRARLKR